jgi:hypothetical protein
MIKKIIISNLFILLAVGILGFTTTLAAAAPFNDTESPGPTSYYAANINLTVGTPINVTLPIVDITPGKYDDFKVTATNTSTVPSSLIVTLNNSTATVGTGIYQQKHGDSVIGTSGDLANITNITVWVDTSIEQVNSVPSPSDSVMSNTGVWSAGADSLPEGFALNSIPVGLPLASNPLNMTGSTQYTIHYIVGLPSTLTGSQVAAGTSIQGEQGSIGNILALQNN